MISPSATAAAALQDELAALQDAERRYREQVTTTTDALTAELEGVCDRAMTVLQCVTMLGQQAGEEG